MLTYAGVAVVKPEIILGPWQTSETTSVHVLGIRREHIGTVVFPSRQNAFCF